MRRVRIRRTATLRAVRELEALPLDPRDPDVLRAKELERRRRVRSPRRAA